MGGDAFGKNLTSRISTEKLEELKVIIENKLGKYISIFFCKNLRNKASHGDIDVYYLFKDSSLINVKALLTQVFSDCPVIGHLEEYNVLYTSDDGNKYQIDFVLCPTIDLKNMYEVFFSYSDFGSLTGHILHSYGLSFGQNGLYVKVYKNTIEEYQGFEPKYDSKDRSDLIINLSSNPVEIFDYLGFDYERFQQGFDTENDLFRFIETCKFYDSKSKFDTNNADRKYIQKRPIYNAFVNRLQARDSSYSFNNYSIYQNQIIHINYFHKLQLLDEKINLIRIEKERNTKVDWGQYLVDFPSNRKGSIKTFCQNEIIKLYNNYEEWLDNNDYETINNTIQNIIENIKFEYLSDNY